MQLKQIFFGNLAVNNNNSAQKKEFKSSFLLNNPIKDTVSFGGKKRELTDDQRAVGVAIKQIAIDKGWHDFYTGEQFSSEYRPTIEHIIPHMQKKSASKKGIDVNDITNWVLVGLKVNNKKGDSISLGDWYRQHPEYLENGRKALKEYENLYLQPGAFQITIKPPKDEPEKTLERVAFSPEIDGKKWVEGLKLILNKEAAHDTLNIKGKSVKSAQPAFTGKIFNKLNVVEDFNT